jgi:hypothetical protein
VSVHGGLPLGWSVSSAGRPAASHAIGPGAATAFRAAPAAGSQRTREGLWPTPCEQATSTAAVAQQRPLIAGIATLGGTYLFSALVGAMLLSGLVTPPGATCLNCETAGIPLLIPIAGPWIALPHANEATGGQVVMAILGVAQAAGVILTGVGIAMFATSGPKREDSLALWPRVDLQLAPLPGGGYVGLRGAF